MLVGVCDDVLVEDLVAVLVAVWEAEVVCVADRELEGVCVED